MTKLNFLGEFWIFKQSLLAFNLFIFKFQMKTINHIHTKVYVLVCTILAACGGSSDSSSPSSKTFNSVVANPTAKNTLRINSVSNSLSFTWIGGSEGVNQNGNFGSRGVSPEYLPGARWEAVSWKDASGNFWVFGGHRMAIDLNDLWKFDPLTGLWTWMGGSDSGYQPGVYGLKGQSHSKNVPGSRMGSANWTDKEGNFWLFGGSGSDKDNHREVLNDLWKYSPLTNVWTWVSGSSSIGQNSIFGIKGVENPHNMPGARGGAISWIDNHGCLWLFGGYGLGGRLNDLWKFNPTTQLWNWVAGSNISNRTGVYGIRGQADTNNMPGARNNANGWTDAAGNFWLYGGAGYSAIDSQEGILSDLWKYDVTTNQWTWVSGSKDIYQDTDYYSADKHPGSRMSSTRWVDHEGNFWLFGGYGNYVGRVFSDFWKYNPMANQWTCEGGCGSFDEHGAYGTMGLMSERNRIGGRIYSVGWSDADNNFWLFGGDGYAATKEGSLNDLWKINVRVND